MQIYIELNSLIDNTMRRRIEKNSKKQQVSIFVCNIKTGQRTSWSFILVYAGDYTQTKEIKIRENVTFN